MDIHNSEYGILQQDSPDVNPSQVRIFGLNRTADLRR